MSVLAPVRNLRKNRRTKNKSIVKISLRRATNNALCNDHNMFDINSLLMSGSGSARKTELPFFMMPSSNE
jgi:hypothetical protein